jgi:hypothetical protein
MMQEIEAQDTHVMLCKKKRKKAAQAAPHQA